MVDQNNLDLLSRIEDGDGDGDGDGNGMGDGSLPAEGRGGFSIP